MTARKILAAVGAVAMADVLPLRMKRRTEILVEAAVLAMRAHRVAEVVRQLADRAGCGQLGIAELRERLAEAVARQVVARRQVWAEFPVVLAVREWDRHPSGPGDRVAEE